MSYETFISIKDIIIVLLILIVIGTVREIRELKRTLTEEKRKRSMPLLTLEVNTDDDIGVFLTNDSYCYAKNINIGDLDVIVDYGFKKHITLKFDPLEILKPSGKIKLDYRVFDGEYDVTSSDAKNILNHFSDAPIEIHLHYENIEGGSFASTIGPNEKNKYIIKEIAALQK